MYISRVPPPKTLRSEERRVLRCAAAVISSNSPPVHGKTVDVSSKGISVMLPRAMNNGDQCTVAFNPSIDGKTVMLSAPAKVVYSICVGTSGFRTGFQFEGIDDKTSKIIKELAQSTTPLMPNDTYALPRSKNQ
ncbi:MAG: PilZ domain-containing protein [Burkholderiales bacterium]